MKKAGVDWYRKPEIILADLLGKAARDEIASSNDKFLYRALVLAVDVDGGKLQNQNGTGEIVVKTENSGNKTYKAIIGLDNPRGSVKARILTDGFDRLLDDDEVAVFWPMLPYDQFGIPISPGEHVYVIFENKSKSHGMWLSRVSGHESASSFEGVKSYTATSSPVTAIDSFFENEQDYQKDENYASLTQNNDSAMRFFGDNNE